MNSNQITSICKCEYGDIYYQVSGPDNAPAIIFIHDVGMTLDAFENQVAILSKSYKTIVWDLPGHGRSTIIKSEQRFTSLAADCLFVLTEEVGVEKAFIVGQSLGNIIAQRFQLKHPEKVYASVHVPETELKNNIDSWSKIFTPVLNGVFNLLPSKTFYRSLFKQQKLVNDYA